MIRPAKEPKKKEGKFFPLLQMNFKIKTFFYTHECISTKTKTVISVTTRF